MDYKNTNLDFLEEDLIKDYGPQRGGAMYAAACDKLAQLCAAEQRSADEMMNTHIFQRILPAIALYLSLIQGGYAKEEALAMTLKETQHNAIRMKEENAKLAEMPFSYAMFKLFAKSHMKKSYPAQGWDVVWRRLDNREVHFDMTRCIYKDMCDKYDCPELCAVFCQNDVTAFAGYLPKIGFERRGTLAEGSDRCDFHFIKL